MRQLGTVPVYRAMDAKSGDVQQRRSDNAASLAVLADSVAGGDFACLFPEGNSHDDPYLNALKTGVARFYFQAKSQSSACSQPYIIPVGLHYDAKRSFRSNVLVAFHPPIEISPHVDLEPDGDTEEQRRDRCRALTTEIDEVLKNVVHATDSWETHHLLHRTRSLVRAERAARSGASLSAPGIEERTIGFARVWTGYNTRLNTHPQQVQALRERISAYDDDMYAMGIRDHELDKRPKASSVWSVAQLVGQLVLVFMFIPPLLVVGYLVNLPPFALSWLSMKRIAKRQKDEASVKLLAGVVFFPLSWLLAGVLSGWTHEQLHQTYPIIPDTPVLAGVTVVVLGLVGGLLALRYARMLKETVRATRVRLTRARRRVNIARLKVERSEIFDDMIGLVSDIDLPGSVGPDGRVVFDETLQDLEGWTR